LTSAAWVRNLRKEWSLANAWAEATISHSSEQGLVYFLPAATIFRGWAQAEVGSVEQGVAHLRHGLAVMPGSEELFRPCALSLLAVACGKLRQTDDALALVDEALAMVEKTGERFARPAPRFC
jgi:predicted ATPase